MFILNGEITHFLYGWWRRSSMILTHIATSGKNSARRTSHFLNLCDSRCITFEITDILNINYNLIFDNALRLRLTIRQYNVRVQWDKNTHTATGIHYRWKLFIHRGKIDEEQSGTSANVTLEDNCIAFIFDEIWYELNGVDRNVDRNVDIISTFKNYVTVSDRSVILQNTGRIVFCCRII